MIYLHYSSKHLKALLGSFEPVDKVDEVDKVDKDNEKVDKVDKDKVNEVYKVDKREIQIYYEMKRGNNHFICVII